MENSEDYIRKLMEEILEKLEKPGPETSKSAEQVSRGVLEDLADRVVDYKDQTERLEKRCQAHNQYRLFDLAKIFRSFDIDDEIYDQLTFRENLIVMKLSEIDGDLDVVPVGGLCVDVQKAEGRQPIGRQMEEYEMKLLHVLTSEDLGQQLSDCPSGLCDVAGAPVEEDPLEAQNEYGYSKFLVHVSSQLDVDGNNGGSTITSWVDRNLHTLEELRKEFLVDGDYTMEESLFTAMKKNWYYVKHTSSEPHEDERKLHSMEKMAEYVSEGANFVLMRYLAVSRYIGTFELSAMHICGDMCRNIYNCTGPESGTVGKRKVDLCKIHRVIIEENGITHESISLLTLHGRLIKQEWKGCDYLLHINPNINFQQEKPKCVDNVLLGTCWESDMQLLSNYMDEKDKCLLQNRSYMIDHPELKNVMRDYVNTILLLRPSNVMDFTFKYFHSMTRSKLPRNQYFY